MQQFLDLGVAELNELLTRNVEHGLLIPDPAAGSSSSLVITGPPGSGKTALLALMAKNLNFQRHDFTVSGGDATDKKEPPGANIVIPVCIYISLSQPALGIRTYLQSLLGASRQTMRPDPVIISPLGNRGLNVSAQEGLAECRRLIFEILFPLQQPMGTFSKKQAQEALERFEKCLAASPVWADQQTPPLAGELEKFGDTRFRMLPTIFVDPLNVFFGRGDSRPMISELFAAFRSAGWPFCATLENVPESQSEEHRQLVADVQFEADVVLNITQENRPYARRYIEVTKSRNSQPTFGLQVFRLEKPSHPLSNVLEPEESKSHPGLVLLYSVHWYLSRHRTQPRLTDREHRYHTGITTLDKALSPKQDASPTIEPDAVILVRGPKGGHKLSLSFNLLIAGLWDAPARYDDDMAHLAKERGEASSQNTYETIQPEHTVLLLSFADETSLQIPRVAISRDKVGQKDNGTFLRFLPRDPLKSRSVGDSSVGSKVEFTRWSPEWLNAYQGPKAELIECTLRPGHLTAAELIWILRGLIRRHKPCRILLSNTVHLAMRFPELASEQMLFPALTSLTRHYGIALIINHVEEPHINRELSIGLAAHADYVITLSEAKPDSSLAKFIEGINNDKCKLSIATAEIMNVRGKNYISQTVCVTARLPESTEPHENVLITGIRTSSQDADVRGDAHGETRF